MKIGIIAEGPDDIVIVANVIKKLKGIDTSDIVPLLPADSYDETDIDHLKFSNWELVLNAAEDGLLMNQFFNLWEDVDPVVVFHIDTAERGMKNYDIPDPTRTKGTDYKVYSAELRDNVRAKFENMIPVAFRDKIAYAIAIEETEAWLIPVFENNKNDSASHAKPKEHLEKIINSSGKQKSKYTDTEKKRLDAVKLGKLLSKNLKQCRLKNTSLNLFCNEIEAL